jgi:hypothetical protein
MHQWFKGRSTRGKRTCDKIIIIIIIIIIISGALSPFPQYVFMEWCLVKHRDNFTIIIIIIIIMSRDRSVV